MSQYLERAKEIRAIATPHYNCAQGVLVAFAEAGGMSEEMAFDLTRNFGGGMKIASVCGAITGGLMTLGLFGVDDPKIIARYFKAFKDNHQGCINCADLLRMNKATDTPKKVHCDEMVFEAVTLVEKILKEEGKL